ncbi:hypothetical protein VNO78_05987 [Psophocarpus tetragonolobus]|uniref:Uncharacterized protein n=1 Tax=Psophocarpus tetragonolobus TaxID=3891 RepID=A0AAN9T0R1_PSOTE
MATVSSMLPNLYFSIPLVSFRIGSTVCSAISTNVSERKSANYQANLWNYDFLQSLKNDYVDLKYENRARKMQEEVRRMIKDESADIWGYTRAD